MKYFLAPPIVNLGLLMIDKRNKKWILTESLT